MARKSFSRKERVRIFELYIGQCYLCRQKIQVGEVWEIEHVVPWELTRDDSDENLRVVHEKCHKPKTSKDVKAIRKADRIKAKHMGAWPKSKQKIPSRGFRK